MARDGEAQTLDEYRRKYSLYHTDERLLEVRRQFPLLAIWDDHEVEDNYAGGLPGGAAKSRRVPFADRRANGYRAWYEHMPRTGTGDIYGRVPLGAAELFLLDTRQYRDDQPCNPSDAFVSNPCLPSDYDKPGRTLLGATQKAWLKDALAGSQAKWKLIANQVMITSLDAPPHNPINTDSWDGYGAERAELIDFIGASGIKDVSFITGDIHTYFTGEVTRSGRRGPTDGPVRATEFVGGAIMSPGIVDRAASTEAERIAAAAPADAAVLRQQPAPGLRQPGLQGLLHRRGGRRPARRALSGGPRAARSRLGRVHPAPLPGGLRSARGHRRGWPAAGVSPAAQCSSATTCAPVSPVGGSVVTSSVGAEREEAHARQESSWASSSHASGRSPAWASIASSFQCLVAPSCAVKVRNGSAVGKTSAPRRCSLAFSSHPLHQTRSKGAARRCRCSEAVAEIKWTMPSTFSHVPCGRLSD